MSRYIKAGYVGRRGLANVTEKAARRLNVINIAFGYCKNSAADFDCDCADALARIRSFNPELRILLSIGGWGAGGFSPMASTAEGRAKFASTSAELLRKYSLDGIDIDWEYPCIDSAGIEASPDDRVNFTLMLAALREALDCETAAVGGKPWLTIAVGSGEYFIENTEMDKVARIVDYVSIMTYDMRGAWTHGAGHHTNLLKPADPRDPASAEHSVEIYTAAGVPKEKIVIGAAFYSRQWKGIKDSETGLGADAESKGGYGPSFSELYANYIGKNGYVRYFDETARAPYLFNGDTFISYDDEQSVAEKCRFVKERGLLGVMYWEHDCDKTGRLLEAINAELSE